MQLDEWHITVETDGNDLSDATALAVLTLVEAALHAFVPVLEHEARTRDASIRVTLSQ